MAAPCIITVAITGSLPRKKDNPAVPITVAEQIESTQQAFEAGATLVHLHVRNDDESPTSSPERFAQVLDGIRKHCPGMITQVSTGGRSGAGRERGGMLLAEAGHGIARDRLGELPDAGLRQRTGSRRLAGRGDAAHGVKPEVEAFDLSMIFSAGEPAEGRQDQGAAARPVRDGREERDAGGPRGLRVLRQDARSAWRPTRHGRAPASERTSSSCALVARARRALPHRPRGQRAPRSGHARAVERGTGQAGRATCAPSTDGARRPPPRRASCCRCRAAAVSEVASGEHAAMSETAHGGARRNRRRRQHRGGVRAGVCPRRMAGARCTTRTRSAGGSRWRELRARTEDLRGLRTADRSQSTQFDARVAARRDTRRGGRDAELVQECAPELRGAQARVVRAPSMRAAAGRCRAGQFKLGACRPRASRRNWPGARAAWWRIRAIPLTCCGSSRSCPRRSPDAECVARAEPLYRAAGLLPVRVAHEARRLRLQPPAGRPVTRGLLPGARRRGDRWRTSTPS